MRTPVYCPSCREYWWSLDDGIVGMECGLGAEPGVVRRATEDEVDDFYAEALGHARIWGPEEAGLT